MANKHSSKTARVALIQMACETSPALNLKKALDRIKQAKKSGAQIICLQELFLTPYFCQTEDDAHFLLAESIPGPTSKILAKAAARHKITLIASLFERRAEGLYHNTAVTFDESGTLISRYRKMHIPDDPRYYEKFYFTPGDTQPGFFATQTKNAKIGTLICWDQWYPEAARLTALLGAQIIFYPTAIGWHKEDDTLTQNAQADAWELIQRSHALSNGCFVCAVNRVGTEGADEGLTFWGNSFIADPFGRILAKASSDKEEILQTECSLDAIDWTRRHWPFLRDRRIDAYGGIVKRHLGND